MADNPNTPLFADRYRFEPVDNDWDRGRSGSTDLVYDLEEKRRGVIKRAEIMPRQANGIKNEVKALRILKGLGVPDVYDADNVIYNSKNYDYMVIEYIDALRVEKNLDALNVVERADIITKLFSLLSQAHQNGIVNGDVDLKHLFWRRDKRQLVVIDWGNAKLGVDPKKNTEFAYDLARAAEIIFSLVTRRGHPAATGPISLPEDSALIGGLVPLPLEFHILCKWAPRTPSESAEAPYTAKDLFEVSRKWFDAVNSSKPYKPNRSVTKRSWLVGISLLGIIFVALLPILNILRTITNTLSTPTVIITETLPPLTDTLILTELPSPTFTTSPETVTLTPTPVVTPIPSPIVAFDKDLKIINCWINEGIFPSKLLPIPQDGFYQRTDLNWGFNVGVDHSEEDIIQVDFNQCLGGRQFQAFALNVMVNRLTPEREVFASNKEREFGFFLEGQDGHRREYTFWIDKNKVLSLRVRDNDVVIYDNSIAGIVTSDSVESNEVLPLSYKFSIRIFFQTDDQGLDILYLQKGKLGEPAQVEDIDPIQMTRIDEAMLKTLGTIQKIGLVGRGGKTETLIWPLVLLGQ